MHTTKLFLFPIVVCTAQNYHFFWLRYLNQKRQSEEADSDENYLKKDKWKEGNVREARRYLEGRDILLCQQSHYFLSLLSLSLSLSFSLTHTLSLSLSLSLSSPPFSFFTFSWRSIFLIHHPFFASLFSRNFTPVRRTYCAQTKTHIHRI